MAVYDLLQNSGSMYRRKLHKDNNRPSSPFARIPNTYDPSSGSAYYFTEHGEQICEMPEYRVSGRITTANYDEPPVVDGVGNKKFPRAHTAGFGYLFLWFCPIHRHAYGFHLIQGGEGCKDPFSSLYKYLETPPTNVFCDFTCQLSEYCLNREPELFKNTRFWHDLFHAIGHKCGICFKSGRVCGLEGINTEICEQVNAFLQCIKYTAAHLSQEHFTFFCSFFCIFSTKRKQKLTLNKQQLLLLDKCDAVCYHT